MKEKLKLVKEFLLSDTQDQLKSLESQLSSKELTTVSLSASQVSVLLLMFN